MKSYMSAKMSLQIAGLRELFQAFEEGAGKCAMLTSGPLCLVKTYASIGHERASNLQ